MMKKVALLAVTAVILTACGNDDAVVAPKISPEVKADAIAFYDQTLAAIKTCDDAFSVLMKTLESGNTKAGIPLAKQANEVCAIANRDIYHVKVPVSLDERAKSAFSKVNLACGQAYVKRTQYALNTFRMLQNPTPENVEKFQNSPDSDFQDSIKCIKDLTEIVRPFRG